MKLYKLLKERIWINVLSSSSSSSSSSMFFESFNLVLHSLINSDTITSELGELSVVLRLTD